MATDDVESKFAKDREVLRAMIFAVSGGVFAEGHVEDPVQLVLDRPMRSGNREKGAGTDVPGQEEMANVLDLSAISIHPAALQLSDRLDARKGHSFGFDDNGAAPFRSVMRLPIHRFGSVGIVGLFQQADRLIEKGRLVAFEGKRIIGAGLQYGRGRVGPAMQGVSRHDAAVQRQTGKSLQDALSPRL